MSVVLSELKDVQKVRRYYWEATQVVASREEKRRDIDACLREIEVASLAVPSLLN